MHHVDGITLAILLVVYVFLLHFNCLQSQDIPAQCDMNQKCACCSRNDTCLSGIMYEGKDDYCLGYCSGNDCTGSCIYSEYCLIPCKDGYWGGRCVNKCPDDCISCSQYYGNTNKCTRCVVGKYGHSCANKCPYNCSKNICNNINGSCLNCNPGYYSQDCSRLCPTKCMTCSMLSGSCDNCTEGYYGSTCEIECPSNCATKFCLQANGTCHGGCKQSFDGALCDICRPGKYGENCSKYCSPGCKSGVCDRKHGNCTFGCNSGFSDAQYCCTNNTYCAACATVSACQTCGNNTYGNQCQMKCPEMCKHGVCNIDDGLCTLGCINSSTDRYCKEGTERTGSMTTEGFPTAPVVGAIISTLTVLVILVAILVHRHRYLSRSDTTISTRKEVIETDHMYRNTNQGFQTVNDNNNGDNVDKSADVNNENHADEDREIFPNICKKRDSSTKPYYNEKHDDRTNSIIGLGKIRDLISKSDETYRNEFKMLPEGLIKQHNNACKPGNMKRNRYNAIFPYDENRVKVSYDHIDYINASYIDGFRKPQAYIAALGPTEKTIGDFAVFWKMVWQNKVEVIVMLTRLVESSGMKCDQYWPDNEKVTNYGDITIQCECEDKYAELTARQFTMTFKQHRRELHHIQFTAWPDKGVPDDIISIINLRQSVVRIGRRFDGPLLVHCSAGIGRTGTYIALDILSKQGAAEKSVDVFACVKQLRQQRVNMVQIMDQYKFLHYAVAWTLMVDIEHFPASSFQELSWVDRKLSDMYEMLQLDVYHDSDIEKGAVVSNKRNTLANRDKSDIPGCSHTVNIWNEDQIAVQGTGYINAVYIDGFRRRNRFITAQTPLPATVSDFLNMIIQCDPCCIIDLEPAANNQQDVGKYLPAANASLQEGSHVFKVIGREHRKCYTKRIVEVCMYIQSRSENKTIEHFVFNNWPASSTVPDDATHIIDLIQDVEATLAKTEKNGPILIHCLNGAVRSGMLCGVWLAIERLEHEQRVNVLNTLRQVKNRRRQTITNKEQLRFCFECVSTYVNRFERHVYSNQ